MTRMILNSVNVHTHAPGTIYEEIHARIRRQEFEFRGDDYHTLRMEPHQAATLATNIINEITSGSCEKAKRILQNAIRSQHKP